MFRKYWKQLVLSSLITLLPILIGLLLWDRLPGRFATHWGADGQADGWSSKHVAVFVLPLILTAAQWICVWFTVKEGSNQDRNHKPLGMVLWIIPAISLLSCGITYSLALGADFSVTAVMVAAMGLMFVFIGNYLPKCRYNHTLGIKLPWTFSSEENWNATHRFGGRVWMVGGVILTLSAFLPGEWSVAVMLLAIGILVVIPTVYSYRYYKMQQARGDALQPLTAMRGSKISLAILAVVLAGVLFFMLSGKLEVQFEETSFNVEATYWDPLTVDYTAIDHVEYRDEDVGGSRVYGFGSAKLLLGTFENEEFGYYVRYSYTGGDSCVVLDVGGQTLVIGMENAEATREIYEELIRRTQD